MSASSQRPGSSTGASLATQRSWAGHGSWPLGWLALWLWGLTAAAAACKFEADSNPYRGCGVCRAPDFCHEGFCVRTGPPVGPEAAAVDPPPPVEAGPSESCSPGLERICYDGPAGSDQYPPCRIGRTTCTPERTWSQCSGQITPIGEQCNAVDDDCDGQSDELLVLGARVCRDGRFVCDAPSMSVPELCDVTDNDCDGETDEDFDLSSDPLHCGACDIACAETEVCCDGTCADITSEVNHCGECGMRCPRGTTCCGGGCVDTSADANHCGACENRCGGGMGCCDGECFDTQTDRNHCGPFCLNCAAGDACCFGSCANLTTFQHCGSCENVCATDELCCSGTCMTGTCPL